MADRTSAALFGSIFEYLAKNPDARAQEFARDLWAKTGGYDFSEYQMGCDDALRKLGLLRDGPDEDGHPTLIYGPRDDHSEGVPSSVPEASHS